MFCSFLALVLRKELQDRLERKGWCLEWADVLRDLDRLQEVDLSIGGKSYVMRTKGTVGKVFPACGVAIPPTLRAADPSRTKEWTVTQDLAQSLARWRKSPPPEVGKTSYTSQPTISGMTTEAAPTLRHGAIRPARACVRGC